MRKPTEVVLVVSALVALLWFGWNLAERTVVGLLVAQQQVRVLDQKLAACQASQAKP